MSALATKMDELIAQRKKLDAAIEAEKALGWLCKYSYAFEESPKDNCMVDIELQFAGSCAGSAEANGLLERIAMRFIPNIFRAAIEEAEGIIAYALDERAP